MILLFLECELIFPFQGGEETTIISYTVISLLIHSQFSIIRKGLSLTDYNWLEQEG